MTSTQLLNRINNRATDAHNRIVNHFCKTADILSKHIKMRTEYSTTPLFLQKVKKRDQYKSIPNKNCRKNTEFVTLYNSQNESKKMILKKKQHNC